MEIRIYNPNLYRLGQLENQTSLIWTRKFFEPGQFELHAPITEENLKLLKEDNIIFKKGGKEAGIIEEIEKEENEAINEIVAKGRFASSYMDRRLIKSTVNFSGKIEEAMQHLLGIVEPIPTVNIGELKGFEEEVSFQATMKNLLKIITKLSKAGNIGFRFAPDFKKHMLTFETYKGADRTINQRERPRVIFSESYSNLNNAKYWINKQNFKTLAIVGGEGEGEERVYVTVGGGEGLELREIFVDAKDISSDGLSETEYRAALVQRGQEALNEHIVYESMECEADPAVNFQYLDDYDLGDIVTVKKKKWGVYMNQRITEIQEIYEHGEMYVVPTFGSPLPETINWEE